MAFSFRDAALNSTTLTELMKNRERIKTEDIIKRFPDGITITEFDMVTTPDRRTGTPTTYPVFVFAEDESKFGYGGKVLNSIVSDWVAAFDGDIAKCSAALKASGGCRFKFEHSTTRDGKNLTSVTPV
jgi:hypothetical protein